MLRLGCLFYRNNNYLICAKHIVFVSQGFLRVYEDMPDICLDVPLAYTVLERFVERCHKAGFLSDELVRKMPTRGRKRFVSEGDGGRVKDHNFL